MAEPPDERRSWTFWERAGHWLMQQAPVVVLSVAGISVLYTDNKELQRSNDAIRDAWITHLIQSAPPTAAGQSARPLPGRTATPWRLPEE